jgi:hypothetical protein
MPQPQRRYQHQILHLVLHEIPTELYQMLYQMRSSWKRCCTRVRSFNGTWKITLLLSEEGFKGKVEVGDELFRSSEIFG